MSFRSKIDEVAEHEDLFPKLTSVQKKINKLLVLIVNAINFK